MGGGHQEKSDAIEGIDVSGHRHDESVILLDPYATTVIGRRKFGELGLVKFRSIRIDAEGSCGRM